MVRGDDEKPHTSYRGAYKFDWKGSDMTSDPDEVGVHLRILRFHTIDTKEQYFECKLGTWFYFWCPELIMLLRDRYPSYEREDANRKIAQLHITADDLTMILEDLQAQAHGAKDSVRGLPVWSFDSILSCDSNNTDRDLSVPHYHNKGVSPASLYLYLYQMHMVKVRHNYKLHSFPFDCCELFVKIKLREGERKFVEILEMPSFVKTNEDNVFITRWSLHGHGAMRDEDGQVAGEAMVVDFSKSSGFKSHVTARFIARRRPMIYLLEVHVTNSMILFVALASFCLRIGGTGDQNKIEERFNLVLTGMLSIIALRLSISDKLPELGYLTFIDVKNTVSLMFLFALAAYNYSMQMLFGDDEVWEDADLTLSWSVQGTSTQYAAAQIEVAGHKVAFALFILEELLFVAVGLKWYFGNMWTLQAELEERQRLKSTASRRRGHSKKELGKRVSIRNMISHLKQVAPKKMSANEHLYEAGEVTSVEQIERMRPEEIRQMQSAGAIPGALCEILVLYREEQELLRLLRTIASAGGRTHKKEDCIKAWAAQLQAEDISCVEDLLRMRPEDVAQFTQATGFLKGLLEGTKEQEEEQEEK
eukprot:g1906.t1